MENKIKSRVNQTFLKINLVFIMSQTKVASPDNKRKAEASQTEPAPKRRRVSRQKPDVNAVFIRVPETLTEEEKKKLQDILHRDETKPIKVISGDRVIVKPDENEIWRRKNEYRQEYRSREENIKKRQEKSKDPAILEKRKAYSQIPEVKARKSMMAKVRRQALRHYKENNPSEYFKLIDMQTREIMQKA